MEQFKSESEKRKRKALLVLPILVVPFITLGFWALGGGKGSGQEGGGTTNGLNLALPDVVDKNEVGLDKLRFYEQADRDSAEWRRRLAQDRHSLGLGPGEEPPIDAFDEHMNGYNPAPPAVSNRNGETERLIYKKLGEINRQLNAAPESELGGVHEGKRTVSLQAAGNTGAAALRVPQKPEEDSELTVLNQMMDKILDIQHPDRVKDKLASTQGDKPVRETHYAINTKPAVQVEYFGAQPPVSKQTETFAQVAIAKEVEQEQGITAVINRGQVLGEGSVLSMRILKTFYVNGNAVPAGTQLYGTTTLRDSRLIVNIPSIAINNRIYPVAMTVYDLDGLEGIHVPQRAGGKAVSESMGNSLQSIPLLTLDPSLKAQAASAGAQAIKSLVGKRARQVKVTLPAGYQVILQSSK